MQGVMKVNQEKLLNLARIMGIVAKISFWAMVVIGSAAFLAIPLCHYVVPARLFLVSEGSVPGLNIGQVYFDLTMGIPNASMLSVLTIILVMAGILFFVLAYGLTLLRKILGSVQEGNPFAPANSGHIKRIGFLLILGAFLGNLGEYAVIKQMIRTLELTDISARFSLNAGMLLAGFLVLILAGIFQYGSLLQQEVDATI